MAVGLNSSKSQGAKTKKLVSKHRLSTELPPHDAVVSLSYPGKQSVEDVLAPILASYTSVRTGEDLKTGCLKPNSIVWADNLIALHGLIASNMKADLIYLDPPYATGLNFQSRSQEHAYEDTLNNAAYLEFMRRRLILMKEVLSDEGSIYVHIGHQMVSELKLLLDEVFGKKNFRNLITRRKCSSKNFTKNQYANLNDYILFYTKTESYIWNKPTQTPDQEWTAREYPKTDQRGQYKLVPVHAPGVRNGATGTEWKGMMPPPGKHWQYTPAKLDEMDRNGEIHWSKTGNPRRKVYLENHKGLTVTDYWDTYRDAHHQSVLITGYPTEKNFEMMKLIVAASSRPEGLVIDPFCGSGSTLHAAQSLSRKWIGIDQSSLAIKTSVNRLIQGRAPMGDYIEKTINSDLFADYEKKFESTSATFDVVIDSDIGKSHASEVIDLRNVIKQSASQR